MAGVGRFGVDCLEEESGTDVGSDTSRAGLPAETDSVFFATGVWTVGGSGGNFPSMMFLTVCTASGSTVLM